MAARLLLATLVFAAAASAAAQQPPAGSTQPPVDYVVGADDVLVITSYDQDDLSGRYAVEADGTFTFPLLGRVAVGGMTLQRIENLVRTELVDRGFFIHPQVTVTVDEYRSQKIYVLGEVRRPGVYTLSGTMRLIEALALADSTLPTAGSEVVIIPAAADPLDETDATAVRVSLSDLQNGDVQQNVALSDGDTILVPRAEDVYVFGEVKNPGAYPLRDEDMTVLQALSMAGGVTDRGSTGRIAIMRTIDGERVEISAELTDAVMPGDTVVVPQRFF